MKPSTSDINKNLIIEIGKSYLLFATSATLCLSFIHRTAFRVKTLIKVAGANFVCVQSSPGGAS